MKRRNNNSNSSGKAKRKAPTVRFTLPYPAPFDLSKVDPKGRLDVLVANSIERLVAMRAPGLLPVLTEQKGVIHSAINSQLGPHALGVDVIGFLDQLKPFAPLIGAIAQSALNNLRDNAQATKPPVKEPDGGKAA
jgi:hypothetical protein